MVQVPIPAGPFPSEMKVLRRQLALGFSNASHFPIPTPRLSDARPPGKHLGVIVGQLVPGQGKAVTAPRYERKAD